MNNLFDFVYFQFQSFEFLYLIYLKNLEKPRKKLYAIKKNTNLNNIIFFIW